MAINSNFSIFHPTILGQYLRTLKYPARPLIANSATAPIGQNIEGTLTNGGKTVDVNQMAKPGQSSVKSYSGTYDAAEDPDANKKSLTIDIHEYVHYKLDKADIRLSPINFVQNVFLPFYDELLTKIDSSVKTEAAKFNAAFAEGGASPTVLDNEDITEAKRILKSREYVSNNLVAIIDSNGEKDLTDLSLFVQANTGADGAQLQRNGFLARKFGFDIFIDELGHSQTVGFDADARLAEALSLDEQTDIDIEDGGAAALDTAPAEGEVIFFGTDTGTDQYYVVDSGSTTSLLQLKEGARYTAADQDAIDGVAGTSQFFMESGAISLVSLGMQSVLDDSPGIMRMVNFDPVNRVNTTVTLEETKNGAEILIEFLGGVKNFYPERGVRYIRGSAAKS